MTFVHVSHDSGIATVRLDRGKVNALNEAVVEQARESFDNLALDETAKAIVWTGSGKFFSFGFDIPEFLSYSREAFESYLIKFTDLYRQLFVYPKPVIAALNGHAIAGGCMLATACDYRLMVPGKAKISLNEVTFGSSVFAGSVEMLKYCCGQRNAEEILCSGRMYTAEQAQELGLVDKVAPEDELLDQAVTVAREMGARDASAFGSIKRLLRQPVAELMKAREKDSIREFVDIWYSESTWQKLNEIKIRS